MEISTDISILLTPREWREGIEHLVDDIEMAGIGVDDVAGQCIDNVCEPDNVLTNEYTSRYGHAPTAESVYRLVVNGISTMPLHRITQQVAAVFPDTACWYGSTEIGHTEIATGLEDTWG